MPADALVQAAESAAPVVSDTASDLLPTVTAIASDLAQLNQLMQALLALLVAFTIIYFAVRWFD
ncbi:hypothetical protein [Agathobaculum sp.]|uniref:hypothetical protein n=1 Tax=Agathobaculum sp. TaxID=2048138 RepID=UPI00352159D4